MKSLKYRSGEEIQPGDRITYHCESGEVEFVVAGASGEPGDDWFWTEFGGGIMLRVESMGKVFLDADNLDSNEDLEFLSRG